MKSAAFLVVLLVLSNLWKGEILKQNKNYLSAISLTTLKFKVHFSGISSV